MNEPGRVAQSVGLLTRKSGIQGSIPGLATYFRSPSAFSRRAVVSYWRKYVHEVLVNRFGGLSLPRKSVVRLTDRPDMTLDVYRGRKTTTQQQQQMNEWPLVLWRFNCISTEEWDETRPSHLCLKFTNEDFSVGF